MGRKREHSKFWSTARKNRASFDMYVERLSNIALSMFEWKELPDTMDADFIENELFKNGFVIVFKDEEIGLLAMGGVLSGRKNYKNQYTRRTAIDYDTGYRKELTDQNSVVIYNDMLRRNTYHGLLYFANRLWDMDRTVDVNVSQQKTPKIIQCGENQKLTVKNLYMQQEGNVPIIYGYKGLDINGLSVFDTTAPFISDKVFDVRDRVWADAMSYLGVPNIQQHKKERMITSEAEMGSGATVGGRFSRESMRQKGCMEIERMFGVKISVKYRDFSLQSYQEGDQDGEIHNPD